MQDGVSCICVKQERASPRCDTRVAPFSVTPMSGQSKQKIVGNFSIFRTDIKILIQQNNYLNLISFHHYCSICQKYVIAYCAVTVRKFQYYTAKSSTCSCLIWTSSKLLCVTLPKWIKGFPLFPHFSFKNVVYTQAAENGKLKGFTP